MGEEFYMENKTLVCLDCGRSFVFTVGEQIFFEKKDLAEPKRCHDCRLQRRLTFVPNKPEGRP